MSFQENINFPASLDSKTNLFEVRDSAQTVLTKEFNQNPSEASAPTSIEVSSTNDFPDSGILTIVSSYEEPIVSRATSIFYTSKTDATFDGISIMPFSTFYIKEEGAVVVMNVMSEHHNQLAEAIMVCESYLGTHNEENTVSLRSQYNELIDAVSKPIPWFSAEPSTGFVNQTEFQFQNRSYRINSSSTYEWKFGDGSTSIAENPTHVYTKAGVYNVTLTVANGNNKDSLTTQSTTIVMGDPPENINVETSVDKTTVGSILWASIDTVNQLGDPITQSGNPIVQYKWDDGSSTGSSYASNPTADITYTKGGLYFIKAKVTTDLGNYAWAKHLDVNGNEIPVDIVERENLWHLIMDVGTSIVRCYELGLDSLIFKVANRTPLNLHLNKAFVYSEYENHLANKGYHHISNYNHVIVWTKNGATISVAKQNALTDSWLTKMEWEHLRMWNWVSFGLGNKIYIVQGATDESNWSLTDTELASFDPIVEIWTTEILPDSAYSSALELKEYPDKCPTGYRMCEKDGYGYIVRSTGPPESREFAKLYSFDPVSLTWLAREQVPAGLEPPECQIVPLIDGIYVFWNAPHVLRYDVVANVWTIASQSDKDQWHLLHDTTALGFDDITATFLATSDGNTKAFLSFDYSPNTLIFFDQSTSTFQKYSARPIGEQWEMKIFSAST